MNIFKRTHKALEGASEAAKARKHAAPKASPAAKAANPQRVDIIRRHLLSGRKPNAQEP